jgi:hypothetical protein
MAFLKYTANDSSQPLLANGVAYHPYQDYDSPRSLKHPKPVKGYIYYGITHLKEVNKGVDDACAADPADRRARTTCDGGLRTPGNKRPPLYLTEFGYRWKPLKKAELYGKRNAFWHTEWTRSAWFAGVRARDGSRLGALDNAERGRAKWLLLYQPSELPIDEANDPQGGNLYEWDTGILGLKPGAGEASSNDIVGSRLGGKKPEKHGQYAQRTRFWRRTYCEIARWARIRYYPNAAVCPRRTAANS